MDTIVSMMQKRKEKCTFDKLKQAVQEMTRRLEKKIFFRNCSKRTTCALIKIGLLLLHDRDFNESRW